MSHPAECLLPALIRGREPFAFFGYSTAIGHRPVATFTGQKRKRTQRTDGSLKPIPAPGERLALWVGQEGYQLRGRGHFLPNWGTGTLSPHGVGICVSLSLRDGQHSVFMLVSQVSLLLKSKLLIVLHLKCKSRESVG